VALLKYARVGELLAAKEFSRPDIAWQALVDMLHAWTERLRLRRLGAYGVIAAHVPKIVAGSRGSSMKTNPIVLTDDEIAGVVRSRL
jgi:alcohol dehydrogenase